MYYILIVLVAFVLTVIISGVKIVPQSQAWVVERLGAYNCALDTGFHFIVPLFDRIAKRVSLKEALFDYAPQPVITKDNVTMLVDSVVFYQISDPKLYTYGVDNPKVAIDKLTTTTLRQVIGELELDETLTSRDTINSKLRSILDDATDAWGIKINRVEVKNIDPPASIKDAMEKQMRAERERRAAILTAEGEKRSLILKAEGEKQSSILQAEAEKQSLILQAEARKQVLIQEAEGEAQAIMTVQKATADGLEMITNVIGKKGAVKLKSFEAFERVADGKSTKIIIPSDIQNLGSLITGITEIAKQ
ncbi:MAG: SPFH/Band 7/PHB domain protein [Spirochaetaceae bacterium]|jgi:regulator of protease activity HflC (stomatin/prohibitin superfamily)|nr:SPFH/Band 7/PHB domain protein [Spirochaetaceae bacterium]